MNSKKKWMLSLKQDVNAKQVSAVLLVFFGLVIILVVRSDGFQNAYGKGYRESFRESFKQSFSELCYGKKPSDRVVRTCDCVLEKMMNELSVKQLEQELIVRKYVEDQMLSSDCAYKV